ncbi:MAG: ribonuclease H-like domain-containing protein [Candidatus Kaiserbacteria bacterium]|nr:ribonuclease H-like domain-containing protein [Candidatus Kaiserbacteria bacterium]
MRVVTFDIESATWLGEEGMSDVTDLSIAIVCIHDSETDRYSSYLESELPKLWPILERTDILVGYNSNHFDIPLLNKYYPGDLTKIKSLDLLVEIKNSLGRSLRLDAIADGTLGVKKIGSGAQSLQWWRAGEIDKVRDYCMKDVELTKKLFDYCLAKNSIKYKELGKTQEVKLNTASWLTPASASMTFSMGF